MMALSSTYMSYISATCLCLSPIIGNRSSLPEISLMSLIQPPWLSMVFALRPMSLTPRLANSGSSFANAPNSVVQTGLVWSAGAMRILCSSSPTCSPRDARRGRPSPRQPTRGSQSVLRLFRL